MDEAIARQQKPGQDGLVESWAAENVGGLIFFNLRGEVQDMF